MRLLLSFVLANTLHFGAYPVGGCKPPTVLHRSPSGKFVCIDKETCVVNKDANGKYTYDAGMPRNHYACKKARGEKKNASDIWPPGE